MKSETSTKLQELLAQVVKRIVDNPEQVKLSGSEGGSTLVIEVSTAKEDVGKLIGRQGANITAIRTLVRSAAGKHGKRVIVEVKEPDLVANG